jgi:hypothetical protein
MTPHHRLRIYDEHRTISSDYQICASQHPADQLDTEPIRACGLQYDISPQAHFFSQVHRPAQGILGKRSAPDRRQREL